LRDIDALLNSLVNIDRNRLVAILSPKPKPRSGWSTVLDSALSSRRLEAEQRAARVDRITKAFELTSRLATFLPSS
jgi:hypothetical protein